MRGTNLYRFNHVERDPIFRTAPSPVQELGFGQDLAPRRVAEAFDPEERRVANAGLEPFAYHVRLWVCSGFPAPTL